MITSTNDELVPESNNIKPLLTTKEVCAMFSVSDRTIYTWRKRPVTPFPSPISLVGVLRYKRSHIDDWIEQMS